MRAQKVAQSLCRHDQPHQPATGSQAKVKEVKIQDVSVKHLDDRPLALLFHSKRDLGGFSNNY